MSKPILYSYYRSTASWRVRIALNLKGIEFEYSPVHLVKDGGEQHKEEYRSINPLGLLPAIRINDTTLTDSIAIIEYLDETWPGTNRLLPEDSVLRAKARALANVIASSTQPIQNLRVLQYVASRETPLDKVQWAKKWITDGLTGYEKMVSSTADTYSVGNNVTIADLCLIPQLYNAKRFGVDMDQFPVIQRIADNCSKLEAFKGAAPEVQPDCPPESK